jgi:hypothetical protein
MRDSIFRTLLCFGGGEFDSSPEIPLVLGLIFIQNCLFSMFFRAFLLAFVETGDIMVQIVEEVSIEGLFRVGGLGMGMGIRARILEELCLHLYVFLFVSLGGPPGRCGTDIGFGAAALFFKISDRFLRSIAQ